MESLLNYTQCLLIYCGQVCVVFLPNQTEENSSGQKLGLFLCPLEHLAYTWTPNRYRAESASWWKQRPAAVWSPAPAVALMSSSALLWPLLGNQTFTCPAFPDYPAKNPSFLPLASYGTCVLGRGNGVQIACVLVTWSFPWPEIMHCSPPHPHTQNSHCTEEGSNKYVWRTEGCDWGIGAIFHLLFLFFFSLDGRYCLISGPTKSSIS